MLILEYCQGSNITWPLRQGLPELFVPNKEGLKYKYALTYHSMKQIQGQYQNRCAKYIILIDII